MNTVNIKDWNMIRGFSLFSGVEQSAAEELIRAARTMNLKRGAFLFLNGAQVEHLYLILQGKIKVYHVDEDGRECVIRIAASGEALCLATLFNGHEVHQALGEAVTNLRALALPKKKFLAFMRENPALTRNVLEILSARLECVHRRHCLSRALPARAQVAHYIMERTGACRGCACGRLDLRPLHITAQEIGIARETLSRIIGHMKKKGAIKCCRGCITICNKGLVEEIARQTAA